MEAVHALSLVDLGLATVLVLIAGSLSLALRLGIGRVLLVATVRTVVQLGLVGLVLDRVFDVAAAWPVGLILLAMSLFAGREAAARARYRYPRAMFDAWLSMAVVGLIVGAIVTQVVVGVSPWYNPQYVIPLVGMILGNSLSGVSLCLDRFLSHVHERRAEIELVLAFGGTRREALRAPLADAVRTGLMPILQAMAGAGIVSLPGMMTGQILAGTPPLQAVAYQIVVMFMLAAATALGTMFIAELAARRVMTRDGLLRQPVA